MSLAYFAASFDDDSNIILPNQNTDLLNQKRHKKTQRKYSKVEQFDTQKVNSVLQQIHHSNNDEDDDDADRFTPPPKPESMGAQKTTPKVESFHGLLGKTTGKAPMPNYEGSDNLDLNDYSIYGDQKTTEEYYRQVMPGYGTGTGKRPNSDPVNRPYYDYGHNNNNNNTYTGNDDLLMQKMNYMISLLEDQHDEKTNNVTEEVILYSFLGIFVIFIADTFVRAGKYTR